MVYKYSSTDKWLYSVLNDVFPIRYNNLASDKI